MNIEKEQRRLYKRLKKLDLTWSEVALRLGYASVSGLTRWHKNEKVPKIRMEQVKLFLGVYE